MAKVLISIDDRLLEGVDRAARARGETRSAFLASLAAREIDARTGSGGTPGAARALRQLDALFADNPSPPGDTTDAIRAMRDAR